MGWVRLQQVPPLVAPMASPQKTCWCLGHSLSSLSTAEAPRLVRGVFVHMRCWLLLALLLHALLCTLSTVVDRRLVHGGLWLTVHAN